MIKIVWSIKDINKYQTGNLPDNAIKIETPKSVDELMKKALPIAVILCVLLFAAMLGKTIVTVTAGSMWQPTLRQKIISIYLVWACKCSSILHWNKSNGMAAVRWRTIVTGRTQPTWDATKRLLRIWIPAASASRCSPCKIIPFATFVNG